MNSQPPRALKIVDTHTGGEPTRVVVFGGPELQGKTMAEKAQNLAQEHEWLRTAVCLEPRGHEAMVGALLVKPTRPDCLTGVIYFNNKSVLHMCIHGSIGVAEVFKQQGKIGNGRYLVETPAGIIAWEIDDDETVLVENVPSYLYRSGVEIVLPEWGTVKGDVAWGGNWFFLIDGYGPSVSPKNIQPLSQFTKAVMAELRRCGVTGEGGGEIDHVEVFAPPRDRSQADSQNFVLCPGGAYDRSPCGTGTSAKIAALYYRGKLQAGQIWRQAGIHGTVFEGKIIRVGEDGKVVPQIRGQAWVTGESTYFLHTSDPFVHGINR